MKKKLLDLFCGAGGCSVGYSMAGFEVTGVDNKPQKRYPGKFIQADAIRYFWRHWTEFDAFHASPPCQKWSVGCKKIRDEGKEYPDFIEPVRRIFKLSGKPYVIENVPGAPLENYVTLCGVMFGLKVFRHRLFESNVLIPKPIHVKHGSRRIGEGYFSVAGGAGRWKSWGKVKRNVSKGTVAEWQDAMGIPWMVRRELTQAIPPAYTEYIGKYLMGRSS